MVKKKTFSHIPREEGGYDRIDYVDDPEPTELEKLDNHARKMTKKMLG